MLRSLLNNLPSFALILLCTGGTIALGFAAELLLARRRGDDHEGDNDMIGVTFEFVGIAYAILIGFVIVSLWETQQAAHDAVSSEAAALEDIAVLDRGLATDDRGRIEAAIRAYVDTSGREFELLKNGTESEASHTAARDIFDAILAAEPESDLQAELQGSMVDSYKDFAGERTQRLDIADERLAGELWMLVLASSLAMVLLIAAFHSTGRWDRFATVIISGTIGLVLFAMAALSYPFSGDVSVDPGPLQDIDHIIEEG